MKAAVIVFPGSNCDRDIFLSLQKSGANTIKVWHGDSELPKVDLVALPGGFSYGDYLRCGAIAAKSPVMKEIIAFASKGGYVLGVCNGFQILTESGLLPGTLLINKNLKFICKDVLLKVENNKTPFTAKYKKNQVVKFPIAHHEGNYFADKKTLAELEDKNLIAFRYHGENPNGAAKNIAGIFNKKKNVLGLMPHPERLSEEALGGVDGKMMFEGLVGLL